MADKKERSKVLKHQRIRAIYDVLKDDELNKPALSSRVAAFLGVSIKSINKSLYRDLSDLVREGSLEEIRRYPNGDLIEEYDPDEHKNTRCSWKIRSESQATFLGESLANAFDISIQASQHSLMGIRFYPNRKSGRTGDPCFSISNSEGAIFFEIDSELRPFRLVFGRNSKSVPDALENPNTKIGKFGSLSSGEISRTIYIRMIDKLMSREHILIAMDRNGKVFVQDLESSNGSKISNQSISKNDTGSFAENEVIDETRGITKSVNNKGDKLEYRKFTDRQEFPIGIEVMIGRVRIERVR